MCIPRPPLQNHVGYAGGYVQGVLHNICMVAAEVIEVTNSLNVW
jgi:hypothetical protein